MAARPPADSERVRTDRLLTPLFLVVLGLAGYRFFELGLYPALRSGIRGGDFNAFYLAAQAYLNGATLYPNPGVPTSYLYPPTLALLLTPLVGQSYALYAFQALGLLSVAFTVVLVTSFAGANRLLATIALGTISLAAWPVAFLLRQGQVDSITLVLMVLGLVLAWHKRTLPAALSIGVAISIKITPGVLVLFFLWKRQYRLALLSMATALAILAAGGLLVGPNELVTYVTRVLPRIGSEGNTYWYNQSLHALFMRLFAANRFTEPVADLGIGTVVLASGLSVAVLLLTALICVPRRWPSSAALLFAQAGAFMVIEVLGASISWQMHAVWLLVPLGALLLVLLDDSHPARWFAPAVGAAALGFLSGPYEVPFEYGRFAEGWLTLMISHTLWAALLMFVLCVYVSRREAVAHARAQAAAAATAHPPAVPVAYG